MVRRLRELGESDAVIKATLMDELGMREQEAEAVLALPGDRPAVDQLGRIDLRDRPPRSVSSMVGRLRAQRASDEAIAQTLVAELGLTAAEAEDAITAYDGGSRRR